MLRQLSARSPWILRVFLTASSALAAVLFASAFSFPHQAAVQVAYPAMGGQTPAALPAGYVQSVAAAIRTHTAHLTHVHHVRTAAQQQADQRAQLAALQARSRKIVKPAVRPVVTADAVQKPANDATTPNAATQASASYSGSGRQACIISRESGGNPSAMNASGHYGLYQFSYSTWVGSGGNGADFGHASVAEQNQVFANAVAARGYSDWAPYDGC